MQRMCQMEYQIDDLKKSIIDSLNDDALSSNVSFSVKPAGDNAKVTISFKRHPVIELFAMFDDNGECAQAAVTGIYSMNSDGSTEMVSLEDLIEKQAIESLPFIYQASLMLEEDVQEMLDTYIANPIKTRDLADFAAREIDGYEMTSRRKTFFGPSPIPGKVMSGFTAELSAGKTTNWSKIALQCALVDNTVHANIQAQSAPKNRPGKFQPIASESFSLDDAKDTIKSWFDAGNTGNVSKAIRYFASEGTLSAHRDSKTNQYAYETFVDTIATKSVESERSTAVSQTIADIINRKFNNPLGASVDNPRSAYKVSTERTGNIFTTMVRSNDVDGDLAFIVKSNDTGYRFTTPDGKTLGANEPLTSDTELPVNARNALRGTIAANPKFSQSEINEVNRIADRIDNVLPILMDAGWTAIAFEQYKGLSDGLKGSIHRANRQSFDLLLNCAQSLHKDLSSAMQWIVSPSGKIVYNPFTDRVYSTFANELGDAPFSKELRQSVIAAPHFTESIDMDITNNYIGSGREAAMNAERIAQLISSQDNDTEMASFIYDSADDENHAFMEAVMSGYCACFEANLGNLALALGLPAAALAAGSWYGAKKMGYDPAELLSQLKPTASSEQVTIPSAEKRDMSEKGGLKDDIYHYAGKLKGKAIDAASDLMAKTSSKIEEFERAHQPEFRQNEINAVDRIVDRIDNDMRILKKNEWTKIPFDQYRGALDGMKGSIHSPNQYSAARLLKCAQHMDEDISGAMYWMVSPSGKIAYNPYTDDVYATFAMNPDNVSGNAALNAKDFSEGLDKDGVHHLGIGMQKALRAEQSVQAAGGKEAERMGQHNLSVLQHPDLPERTKL